MAVRFIGNNLVDEEGEQIFVSFETLLCACLKEKYHTLSIKEIIIEGVSEELGQRVIEKNLRDSALFCKLEAEILKDENYQNSKMAFLEVRMLYRSGKPKISMQSESRRSSRKKYLLNKLMRRRY